MAILTFLRKLSENSYEIDDNIGLVGQIALPDSGVVAGTYGTEIKIPQLSVDSKGIITSVVEVPASVDWSNVTGKPQTLDAFGISTSDLVTKSGNILPLSYVEHTSLDFMLTTNDPLQQVDSVDAGTFRTIKYIIQAMYQDMCHCSEIMVTHDSTNSYMTEYGSITTTLDLYTVGCDLLNGQVRLLINPVNSGTDFKVYRTAIKR